MTLEDEANQARADAIAEKCRALYAKIDKSPKTKNQYEVSCALTIDVSVKIEAESEYAAIGKLYTLDRRELYRRAVEQGSSVMVLDDSAVAERACTENTEGDE